MPKTRLESIFSRFEKLVDTVLTDIQTKQVLSPKAKQLQDIYIVAICVHLKKYDHHQGSTISDDDLILRYQREVAILHVATKILQSNVGISTTLDVEWPVYDSTSFYSWYTLSPEIAKTFEDFAKEIRLNKSPHITLINLCDQLLSKTEKRYIGEFYTPPSIVQHLLNISNFKPSDFIEGKHVVDPACGGGMILASIVEQVIYNASADGYSNEQVVAALKNYIHGFDIQPFAIVLCRTILLSIVRPILSTLGEEASILNNIELIDPLENIHRFWETPIYSYVISNPPFMSIKREAVDYIDSYNEVLFGHPNLYLLFLWWAVKASQKGGVVSLLIPQSLLVGNYFHLARERLNATTTLLDITRMIDRKGIVGAADQQMMTVCFKVGRDFDLDEVILRVTRNGTDLEDAISYKVKQSQVVQNKELGTIWIVSESALDYEIEEVLRSSSLRLGELASMFILGNGGFVWSENPDNILERKERGAIPLISAASISPFKLTFPYMGPHPTNTRQYARVIAGHKPPIHSGEAILIQRTTPTKVGRRLIGAMLTPSFLKKYPQYFLENHVNYISAFPGFHTELLGLLSWLNSDLCNFIFQLRNGSTQVSVFELELMPTPKEELSSLGELCNMILSTRSVKRRMEFIHEMNIGIFEAFGLNQQKIHRIETVLSRKEKSTG